MTEEEKAKLEIRVFDHKYTLETIRSVIFWLCVAGATYWFFKPIEFNFYVRGKVFESRSILINDFITKSIAYTKVASGTIDGDRKDEYKAYRDIAYDEYNQQLGRMNAALGDGVYGLVKDARAKNKKLRAFIIEDSKGKVTIIKVKAAEDTRKELVALNIKITQEATKLQHMGAQIPPEYKLYESNKSDKSK